MVFKRFLKTRVISYKRKAVVMPIIELINHNYKGFDFQLDDLSAAISGNSMDEIFARYGTSDSLKRFFEYGISCEEDLAFSLPLTISNPKGVTIRIGGQKGKFKKNGKFTKKWFLRL